MTALLSAQGSVTAAAGLIGWWFGGLPAATAAVFGGGIALANSMQSAWWFNVTATRAGSPQATLLAIYAGVAQRLLLTVAGFAFGIGHLRLSPVPMLIAFGVAQLGHLAGHWKYAAAPGDIGAASCDTLQR